MLALARFQIMGFVVLTVVYGALWFYLRAKRRARLELDWEFTDTPLSQDAFVREGLEHHDPRRHRFLIVTVYVLPLCLVTFIIYMTNFY